jgi:hypothetical protein
MVSSVAVLARARLREGGGRGLGLVKLRMWYAFARARETNLTVIFAFVRWTYGSLKRARSPGYADVGTAASRAQRNSILNATNEG